MAGSDARGVVILGAGGHGQVVADILLMMAACGRDVTPVAFLDDDESITGQVRLGLPVLGTIKQLPAVEHDAVVLGIGRNRVRATLYKALSEQGETFVIASHPRSIVAAGVEIGPGSVICAGAIVNTGTTIGANVILNTGCTVDHHTRVGDHAHVAPGVHSGGDVCIGSGALVGIGATIMPGRRIGHWSTVGAGALVTRDVADRQVVTGVPARLVRPESEPAQAGHVIGERTHK